MKLSFEKKLTPVDLSMEFLSELLESVINSIKENPELVVELDTQVRNKCTEDGTEYDEKMLDEKILNVASQSLDSLRIYCDFDLEVK